MYPHSVASEAYVRTSQGCASSHNVFTPLVFLPSHPSSLHFLLPLFLYNTTFLKPFPSTNLLSINNSPHLHLSCFSPLRKILTVNHYLRNQDFQHIILTEEAPLRRLKAGKTGTGTTRFRDAVRARDGGCVIP